MVDANVDPLPRFNLGCSVVSASSIRMIRNSESLTNVSRTVKSLSRLIVSVSFDISCSFGLEIVGLIGAHSEQHVHFWKEVWMFARTPVLRLDFFKSYN